MRRNYIVSAILFVSIAAGCKEKAGHPSAHAAHQETVDSSVSKLTKPVNEQVIASIPTVNAHRATRISSLELSGVITYDTRNQTTLSSRVGGRIERLFIKYNYQPVKKGQLIMEIYSPDLAAAQRELIYVANNSPQMLPGAKQRLLLLGMSSHLVEQVMRTGNVLYRVPVYSNASGFILERSAPSAAVTPANTGAMAPSTGNGMDGMSGGSANNNTAPLPSPTPSTPILIREGQYVNAGQTLFTIYQATKLVAEFAFPPAMGQEVKKGQKLLLFPTGNKSAIEPGRIGLIEPVIRNGQNFMTARVYLDKDNFRPGQLLTGIIPIVYSNSLWLPKQALWRLGTRSIVFRKQHGVYSPEQVLAGAESDGFIQINTDISDWEVASNAAYLIDSESFIKAKQ